MHVAEALEAETPGTDGYYTALCDLTEHLRVLAQQSAVAVGEQHGEGRLGGVYRLFAPNDRALIFDEIGTVHPADIHLYEEFSREKAFRLRKHPDHWLSWQSRNIDAKRYPGAVRTRSGYIGSISGYPADVDEAFNIALFEVGNVIDHQEALFLAGISRNQRYESVLQIVRHFAD